MTADTSTALQFRHAGFRIELYGLMTSVHAGDIAPAAAVAFFKIEQREKYRIPFNVCMADDCFGSTGDEFFEGGNPFTFHVF